MPGRSTASTCSPGAARSRAAAGVDSCFYWYDNNWHYLRKWDHLKDVRTAGRAPQQALNTLPDYGGLQLEQSDRVVGRAISMLVKLSWQPADLDRLAAGIDKVFGR